MSYKEAIGLHGFPLADFDTSVLNLCIAVAVSLSSFILARYVLSSQSVRSGRTRILYL